MISLPSKLFGAKSSFRTGMIYNLKIYVYAASLGIRKNNVSSRTFCP